MAGDFSVDDDVVSLLVKLLGIGLHLHARHTSPQAAPSHRDLAHELRGGNHIEEADLLRGSPPTRTLREGDVVDLLKRDLTRRHEEM